MTLGVFPKMNGTLIPAKEHLRLYGVIWLDTKQRHAGFSTQARESIVFICLAGKKW